MRRFTTVDALLVMLVLIWGGNFTVVKAVMREFEPMAFNAIRFSLASVLMAALLWWWERDIKIERSDIPRFFPLALIGNVVYQILFIAGIEKTRAGDATLILAVTPVVTLLLSILFRTEKIHPYSFLGVILSFLGVLLVVYESGGARYGACHEPATRRSDDFWVRCLLVCVHRACCALLKALRISEIHDSYHAHRIRFYLTSRNSRTRTTGLEPRHLENLGGSGFFSGWCPRFLLRSLVLRGSENR